MKRTMTATLLLGIGAIGMSLGNYNAMFHKTYDLKATTTVGKANCLACHEKKSGGKLNSYGADLQKAMKAASAKKLTVDILKKVEGLDSNKNGKTNLEDIKADVLPGN